MSFLSDGKDIPFLVTIQRYHFLYFFLRNHPWKSNEKLLKIRQ